MYNIDTTLQTALYRKNKCELALWHEYRCYVGYQFFLTIKVLSVIYKYQESDWRDAHRSRKGEEMLNIDLVNKLMAERDLTRKALALDMGITESCLSRILSGKRTGSLDVIEGLAKAFPDVDLRDFLLLDKSAAPRR